MWGYSSDESDSDSDMMLTGDPFAVAMSLFASANRKRNSSGGGGRKRKREPTEEKTGYAAYSVAQLKDKCRELGLKVTGNKSELIERIEAQEAGIPQPRGHSAPKTKKGKTAALDISNKIREGLQHFFGEESILAKPTYHSTGARDPFGQKLMYDTDKHGEPFLEGTEVEDLRAALNNEEIFTVQGTLDIDPRISLNTTTGQPRSVLQLPLQEEHEPLLQSITTDAPFGRGSETVIDKTVRNCRQLSPEQFTINNPEWNKLFSTSAQSSLLEEIRQQLSPNNSEITAELYKLLYYPKGSFFKPHVDTQRDPNMFATLVVQLPVSAYCTGRLTVTHKGVTKYFKSERNDTSWVAFYSSCEHSVDQMHYGFRCPLIYNLRRTGHEIPMESLSWDAKIVQKIDKVFDTQHNDEFTLGHLMDYQYAISNVIPAVLKGLDAQIYQAAKQSGKYDIMLAPIQVERTGCGGCGEERNKNLAEEFINEDEEPQFGTWVVDPSEPVNGGRNAQSYAAFTKDPLEALSVKWIEKEDQLQKAKKIARDIAPTGNEGVGALLFYIHACLLIRKKKGDEAKVFPIGLSIDSSPANNNNNDE